ncbi:NAD-dependent epimerase/dehydratase family protein [Alphaproteobacteria bacterium]|nr:NAD-dependent epimerase/dehydratase family protein [Alphaproteobacteria bacterium]
MNASKNAMPQTYERSKFEVENFFTNFSEKNDNPLTIFRPPGVFGKWSRPNFNSVVATFCSNIAHDLPITINDPQALVHLLYIDDLVNQIIAHVEQPHEKVSYPKCELVEEISVQNLANLISSFEEARLNLYVGDLSTVFLKNLYATYIGYLPKKKFAQEIKKNEDERGNFSEILKTKSAGQFSFFTCKPNITRGRHYHHTKSEKFLVIFGTARFRFRHVVNNDSYEIITTHGSPTIIDTIPG